MKSKPKRPENKVKAISCLPPAEIRAIVVDSIKELYENDRYLLDLGNGDAKDGLGCKLQRHTGERAIMFRFAHYLQNRLPSPEHVVDCEYNRNLYDVKTLGQKAIVPDVVVHKRGCHERNLLAIEIKPWWNPKQDYDERKLKGLTRHKYGYEYRRGLWLCLGKTKAETRLVWYRQGRKDYEEIPFQPVN